MTSAELIEEARRWPRGQGVIPSAAPGEFIPRLADALEAAEEEKRVAAEVAFNEGVKAVRDAAVHIEYHRDFVSHWNPYEVRS